MGMPGTRKKRAKLDASPVPAVVSWMMPSPAPSRASQRARTAADTAARSLVVKAVPRSDGFVATVAYRFAPNWLAIAASGRR